MIDETAFDFITRAKAIELEETLFEDLTLKAYPEVTDTLDEWGVPTSLDAERVKYTPIPPDLDDARGHYDRSTQTIALATTDGSYSETTLCHELIHFYEHELDRLNPSLRQLLAVKLWHKLEPTIPDLNGRVLDHLELVGHRELENRGGEHDLLFLLKAYDIDQRLGVPLGTTFGYGYDES